MSVSGPGSTIRLSEIVSALSAALDLTEGQPMGHAIRSCIIGMRIGQELGLSAEQLTDLYYALLLKDSGCSSNSARLHRIMGSDDRQSKSEVKFEDWRKVSLSGLRYLWRNVLPGAPLYRRLYRIAVVAIKLTRNNAELIGARCERGAQIARRIGLSEAAAQAIYSLDEHWDGGGFAQGRMGEEVSLLSRIMNVSQTLEVFTEKRGPKVAIEAVTRRSGTWFDPAIVRIVQSLGPDNLLWKQVAAPDAREYVVTLEPGSAIPATPKRIDDLCEAFAQVIDAKSPWTFSHSTGVAAASIAIALQLGLDPVMVVLVRRAALLHDIGKLGISNSILEKPGKLDEAEWILMKKHPVHTLAILRTISGFEHLAYVAASHHERLDGKGYPDGLTGDQLTLPARIIAVADVFQALTERRPYRKSLPIDDVFKIMDQDSGTKLDAECLTALKKAMRREDGQTKAQAQTAST